MLATVIWMYVPLITFGSLGTSAVLYLLILFLSNAYTYCMWRYIFSSCDLSHPSSTIISQVVTVSSTLFHPPLNIFQLLVSRWCFLTCRAQQMLYTQLPTHPFGSTAAFNGIGLCINAYWHFTTFAFFGPFLLFSSLNMTK